MRRKKGGPAGSIDCLEIITVVSMIWIFSLPTTVNIVFSTAATLCLVICLMKGWICLKNRKEKRDLAIHTRILIFVISAVLGLCFFKKWSVPDSIIMVPDGIINCSRIIIGAAAVVLATGTGLLLLRAVSQYEKDYESRSMAGRKKGPSTHSYLFSIFLIAVITITVCSKSSLLYPFNDAADGNCFFTVGKSLLNGKVVYRDLVEQKGPYIYFLHSAAAAISHNTFLGVYVFEMISAFLFLCIIYKTVRLFNRDIPIGLIALAAAFLFSQGGFFHGDEIEEFCLPSIALTNYYLLRYKNKQTCITPKEMLLVGILAGCIFWSKYTICGYFACWYVIVAIHQIREQRMDSLIRCFLSGLGGVLLSTIPVLVYFAVNHSLSDLWNIYFIANLFNYNNVNTGMTVPLFSLARNIANGIWISLRYNLVNCVLGICGFFWFRTRRERIQYGVLFAVSLLFVCIGMDPQKYYTFIFAAFCAPGILLIWNYLTQNVCFEIRGGRWIPFVISAIIAISVSPNIYMTRYTREELPQYRFAQTIRASQNPTLLNYGFLDCGYYTASETVPDCKYFCKLNVELPEAKKVQDYYVNNGLTEFVVCRDHRIDSEYYELCDSCTYFFENAYRTDYLYRLKK